MLFEAWIDVVFDINKKFYKIHYIPPTLPNDGQSWPVKCPFDLVHASNFGCEKLTLLIKNRLMKFRCSHYLYHGDISINENIPIAPLNRLSACLNTLIALGFIECHEIIISIALPQPPSQKCEIERLEVELLNAALVARLRQVRSLQELARIAFRRALGGVHFASRLARHPKLPVRVREYIACRTKSIIWIR